MQHSTKGELARLHCAVVQGRLAVEMARGQMIEELGEWLCGAGTAPPSAEKVEALERLCEAQEEMETRYARCVAEMGNDWVSRARRRR